MAQKLKACAPWFAATTVDGREGLPRSVTGYRKAWWLGGLITALLTLEMANAQAPARPVEPTQTPHSSEVKTPLKPGAFDATAVKTGQLVPPRVVQACRPGSCLFAGQTVTILTYAGNVITKPIYELKDEFEAATGAKLNIVEVLYSEYFDHFISDVTNRTGKYDTFIASAWSLGELVAADYVISYDRYYNDSRFPHWDINDVLPGPRSLLEYEGKKYMVANDHDGQVMYYRRDLFGNSRHQAAFKQKYGYALSVPKTWDQFRDVAEFFDGMDLNGDGVPDNGLSLHLKVGAQGMFHFMSFSAPFVIGPTNPKHYWFDPVTMKPLLESPGHVQALKVLVDLVKFGPKEMLNWNLGESWDHFLTGRAALAFTWGDLGALAQQEGSKVKGKTGVAHMPGTMAYYSIPQKKWIKTKQPNSVANTTGGSWGGVISKYSKVPEATYYLLALMATKEKSLVYAARGWDGIDPGRYSHFLPPNGSASIDEYLKFGWDAADIHDYSQAYFDNFKNKLQLPFLRIPGTFSYWQALDIHINEALKGQVTPENAMKATTVDFEEVTIRLGRERQKRAYRASMGR